MANRKVTLDVSDSIIAAAVLASFPLNKADRILEAHPSDHNKVVVKGSNLIPLRITDSWFLVDTDTNVDTTADIDTGAVEAGKDYCVYACDDSGTLRFKISLATTFPAGFDANTSRKIGGFHTLCGNVGTIAGHTLSGYLATEILPASVWDLKHRPVSEPAGMVYSEGAHCWVDIYLTSGTGVSTASVNGGTISDTRTWLDFVDDFAAVKKSMLTDAEFQIIAAGSNEETNIAGSADPVTTGPHIDTAGRRMISNIGCEDCCGVMWQWLEDYGYRYDADVVPTYSASAKTLTGYHVASPGGNPIYLKYSTGGMPYLCCNMATDTVDKILTFGSAFTVRITHDASAASGGVQVYFDEDATQPYRLLAVLPGLKNEFIKTSDMTNFLPIKYDVDAATKGVALHFDDGADERLEFTSPTTTNGTIDLCYVASPAWNYYDLPGVKGSLFRQGLYGDIRLLAGADWAYGTYSGSRSRLAYRYRWFAASFIGSRGRSEPR
jgi:hypothetical protein